MRWTRGYRSRNVEDRRGRGGAGAKLGVGGGVVGLVVVVVYMLLGGDPRALVDTQGESAPTAVDPEQEELVSFVSFVLDDNQAVWAQKLGARYRPAKLVVFTGQTPTACGTGDAAMGPFYCPGDEKVYIDLGFYRELRQRFGAPGDFAQAYVIAHEIGHHVQHQLGLLGDHSAGAEGGSVRSELQADCFAGVWASATSERGILEAGDLDEAMRAASSIGDDTLQRSAGRAVSPDSFTHGSSEQRRRWLMRGYESGDPRVCDTSSGPL